MLLIGIGCAAFLTVIYLIAKQGISAPTADPSAIRATIAKLKDDTAAAEAAWAAAETRFKADGSEPTEDDLRLLDTLVEARATLETKLDLEEKRHPALLKQRDDYRGLILHRESLAVEKQGIAAENLSDNIAAEALYLKAAELERRLADKYPASASKNIARIVTLESRANVLRAKPLWEKSKADEAEADAKYAAGDINGAIAAYERAWASHTKLDTDYRGITPADLSRTRTLGRKRADAGADAHKTEVLRLTAEAEAKAEAGDFDAIPERRDRAEAAVDEIAKKYPESTYAAESWATPIRRRLATAHATKDARRVDRELRSLEAALRRADFAAATGIIEGLATEIARIRDKFKGCDRPTQLTLDHAGYLRGVRNEIALVHKVVNPRLRPVPGRAGLQAFDTETTQALYALVVHDDNPSAVRGDSRPVESLTRDEAEMFCRKLGWILGRRVRLPDEAEFRAIAGETAALPHADMAKLVRCIDTGDGSATIADARPASASGYRDTLGNLAEWIAGEPARVAGGDAESTLDQLAAIPVKEQPASQRSRYIGFRFVVEPTADTP